MSNRISILAFAFLLLFGCGRQADDSAKHIRYDNAKAALLMEICERISGNRDAEIPPLLQKLEQNYPTERDFIEELRLTLQRREDISKMAQLLRNGDYETLRETIRESQERGIADPTTFQYDSLPDALLELARFRARMPWEDSTLLEQALLQLELYSAPLEGSAAFQEFRREQLATLQVLREKKAREHAEKFRARILNAFLSDSRNALFSARRAFEKEQPDHDFFAFLACFEEGRLPPAPPSEELQPFLALAATLQWEKLPEPLRKEVPPLVVHDKSLARQYIDASLSRDFIPFLLSAAQEKLPVAGSVLKDVFADQVIRPSAAYGKSPVPGPVELFSILTNIH